MRFGGSPVNVCLCSRVCGCGRGRFCCCRSPHNDFYQVQSDSDEPPTLNWTAHKQDYGTPPWLSKTKDAVAPDARTDSHGRDDDVRGVGVRGGVGGGADGGTGCGDTLGEAGVPLDPHPGDDEAKAAGERLGADGVAPPTPPHDPRRHEAQPPGVPPPQRAMPRRQPPLPADGPVTPERRAHAAVQQHGDTAAMAPPPVRVGRRSFDATYDGSDEEDDDPRGNARVAPAHPRAVGML